MTPELWAGLVGAFMPYLTEAIGTFIPNKRWLRYSVALVLSIGIGSGTSYFAGEFDAENILSSVGVALIASQSVYNYWFKNKNQDKKVSEFIKSLTA